MLTGRPGRYGSTAGAAGAPAAPPASPTVRPKARSDRQAPRALLYAVGLFDEVDGLTHGFDFFGLLVRDGGFKLVLELHDQLDGVEAVGVEVIHEARAARDFRLVGAHLLRDDLDHLGFDLLLGHGGSPVSVLFGSL